MALLENVTQVAISEPSGMAVTYTLEYILLGIILGMIGQFMRIGIGLKKRFDKGEEFDYNKLKVSIIIAAFVGATAGVFYIVLNWTGKPPTIDQTFLMAVISTGYAGTDFLEALLEKGKSDIMTKYTEDEYKAMCQERLAAVESGEKDTNVLKMEVVKKK
jgi:hypothetical protein